MGKDYADMFEDYLRDHKREVIALTVGVILAFFFPMLLWLGVIVYLGIKLHKWQKVRKERKKEAEVVDGSDN